MNYFIVSEDPLPSNFGYRIGVSMNSKDHISLTLMSLNIFKYLPNFRGVTNPEIGSIFVDTVRVGHHARVFTYIGTILK